MVQTKKRRSSSRRTSSSGKRRKRSKGKKRGIFSFLFSSSRWGYWLGGLLAFALSITFVALFFIDPLSFRWQAKLSEPIYPQGYSIRGIDISRYQEDIDWEQLRNASINNEPIHFVFIKATEGITLIDQNFNQNFFHAKQSGLIRGAYHFFIPQYSAEKQARFFMKQVHLEPGDLPPVLDVETVGGLNDKELQKGVRTWLQIIEAHYGIKPILYTSYKFKERYLNDVFFEQYPFWIAHYHVETLSYKGAWSFWQHTDRGRVLGINGDVDLNVFNGSYEELKALTLMPESQ